LLAGVLSALTLGACQDPVEPPVGADGSDLAVSADRSVGSEDADNPLHGHGGFRRGAVFTMSNQAGGNEILVFRRGADGALSEAGAVSTGGNGSGAGLGNQGGVVLTRGGRWLLAVNAGSDDVSLLRASGYPELADRVPSGGTTPISVTSHGSLVYVLNAGGTENVSGFRIRGHRLVPIQGATYGLSGTGVGPAQVGFSPDGRFLVVSEKATNRLVVFPVARGGRLGDPEVVASAGQTPFGFAFSRSCCHALGSYFVELFFTNKIITVFIIDGKWNWTAYGNFCCLRADGCDTTGKCN